MVYTPTLRSVNTLAQQHGFASYARWRGAPLKGARTGALGVRQQAAHRSALQVYTREQLPQDWAATQNNLGVALCNLGERSEGAEAAIYLQQSVDAYRSALQVLTRKQLPQDWARTQNNLGNALLVLGERSEGAQGAAYLQQSVDAFRSALQVRTEANQPSQWTSTMVALGRAYESNGDWPNALQTYRQLQHHYPNDTSLQSKINQLAAKK